MRETAAWSALAVLGAAAVYELLVAIEVIPIGEVPGEPPPGGDLALVAAMISLLVGAVVCLVQAAAPRRGPRAVWALLPLVGLAYVVARWYSFDPYFAPTQRRFSEGVVAGAWIVGVAASSLVAAGLSARAPRLGAALTAVVLLVDALTAWSVGLGH